MLKYAGHAGSSGFFDELRTLLLPTYQRIDLNLVPLPEEWRKLMIHGYHMIWDEQDRMVIIDHHDSPYSLSEDGYNSLKLDVPNLLYLKLQYLKTIQYQSCVRPFIYCPSRWQYCERAKQLREEYRANKKRKPVWTRLGLTHPSRYDLMLKLRELGYGPEFGGFYRRVFRSPNNTHCWLGGKYHRHLFWSFFRRPWTSREDHLLATDKDVVYDFEEYKKAILNTNCVLDSAGAGDNTHRMIECAAIGAPFIRPELVSIFWDPLIPGKHYVAVRSDFSDLGWAIDSLQNPEFHDYISHNLTDWFDRNILGVRNVYQEIVDSFWGK